MKIPQSEISQELWNFHKKCEIPQNLKTQCYKQISEMRNSSNVKNQGPYIFVLYTNVSVCESECVCV